MNRRLFSLSAVAAFAVLSAHVVAAPKVGVLLKGRTPFWISVEKGATAAGERNGVEVIIKAPLNESDTGSQNRFIDALVEQGIKVLVIGPTNPEALKTHLAAIAAKGIKIVAVDSPLAGNAEDVYIATDHSAYGAAQGELIGKMVTDTSETAIFKHNQTSLSTRLREQAALAKIHEAHAGTRVYTDFFASSDPGSEKERANALLDKYPKLNAVMCSATPGTMAMLAVLEERHLAGKVILVGSGFDLPTEVASAIRAGHLHGWAAQLPEKIGYSGVEAAAKLIKGESVPKEISIGFQLVTRDNLDSPEAQALMTK